MSIMALMSTHSRKFRFFDVAANLSDESYMGEYNHKQRHPADVHTVLQRAKDWGVTKFLLAGGNLKQSQKALDVSRTDESCYCTVGVHPCLANVIPSPDCRRR
jgi:TatD DNase family protein